MRRIALSGSLLVLVACGKEPEVVPVRNLERPSDMAFVCMREVVKDGVTQLSGQPMAECQRHLVDPLVKETEEDVDFNKPRRTGTFGLVTNTSRGELAVVDMDVGKLVDLDRSQPGFSLLPVGAFPEVLSASQDGCMVVTANRGSCDLTVVDPQRLLRPVLGARLVSTGEGPLAVRITPTTGSGRKLQVAPQEIAFLPQKVNPTTAPTMDPPPAVPGENPDALPPVAPDAMGEDTRPAATPADPLHNPNSICRATDVVRAVVTFPACDLVAVLELPSGRIVSSMYVRPEGLVDAGTEPVCPADCGAGVVPQPAPDAAPADAAEPADAMSLPPPPDTAAPVPAGDGGLADAAAPPAPDAGSIAAPDAGPPPRPPVGPFRIGALTIRPEGKRLYVGGASAEFLTAIDISDGALRIPASGGRIPLHDGAGGVRRLRLSMDPYAMFEGRVGRFLGKTREDRKYLYAFARDNSVRVLNVGIEAMGVPREHECDVNVDPRFLGGAAVDCYELTDDPSVPRKPRRAFAQGPGLRIPNIGNPDQQPPVPQDIAFAQVRGEDEDGWNRGGYGYLVASDGEVYILNVDSLNMGAPDNTFRDDSDSPLRQQGDPVVPVAPTRSLVVTNVPLPIRIPLAGLGDGTRLEGVAAPDRPSTVTANLSWVRFPDSTVANSQSWLMVWEGTVPGTERAKGVALAPPPGAGVALPPPPDAGAALPPADGGVVPPPAATAGGVEDNGQEFCQAGVLPRDIVLLPGCTQDTECSLDGTSLCRQALPGTPGLCFAAAQAKDAELGALCARQLISRRRYEVVRSTPRRLDLALKPDELPKTSLDHCTTRDDCQTDRAGRPLVPFEGFDCLQVRPGEPRRCVKPCLAAGDDRLCRAGTVCEQIPDSLTGPLCVEGPPIIPACWPLGARYEVQAGHSFLVTGELAPRPPAARQVKDDKRGEDVCVSDDTRHSLLVNRIPLEAPHCVGIDDDDPENTVKLVASFRSTVPAGPPGTWGNPCLFWGVNDDDVCARSQMGDRLGRRPECNCTPDPTTGKRPPVCHVKALFQNSQLQFVVTNLEQYAGDANIARFDVVSGFRPEVVLSRDDVIVTMGVRVLTGPTAILEEPIRHRDFTPYMFVIDQGRTSSSGGGRGQVLRFNPRSGRTYRYPQFDSNYNLFPFQIQ